MKVKNMLKPTSKQYMLSGTVGMVGPISTFTAAVDNSTICTNRLLFFLEFFSLLVFFFVTARRAFRFAKESNNINLVVVRAVVEVPRPWFIGYPS